MITQCIAEVLSSQLKKQKSEQTVLLLHLDGKSGFDYTTERNGSLDGIRAAIFSEVLTLDELESSCVQRDNLFMLKGTENLLERKTYEPDVVNKILKVARQGFDYIIIDAGSAVESGLTIGCLMNSDYNILVATQQASAYENYRLKEEQVFYPLNMSFPKLIVNKFAYSTGKMLETEKSLSLKYDIKSVFSAPLTDNGWQAEHEKESLIMYKNKHFNQAIQDIVYEIYFDTGKEKRTTKKIFKGS